MRFEFDWGVPDDCIKWLWLNVGVGNVSIYEPNEHTIRRDNQIGDAWYYERIKKSVPPEAFYDDPYVYVPTITVIDEKKAMLFSLRWL